MFIIKEPIWKDRSVGLSVDEASIYETVSVKITYKNTRGERVFPGIYVMNTQKALTYPRMSRRGKLLVLIPIKDFDRIDDETA